MRSKRDVSKNKRHNERKAPILFILVKAEKYLRPKDIAKLAGITMNNTYAQLSKLYRQGYIYRRKNEKGVGYLYRYLKNQGNRVACKLWARIKLKKETDDPRVVLNLKKPIPYDLMRSYLRFEQDYYNWRY